MGRHLFIVLTDAVEGEESRFNTWYTQRHVHDVIAIPGIVAAQRFRFVEGTQTPSDADVHKYLAIYEIDASDADSALAELARRAGTGAMEVSTALARAQAFLYSPISPRISSEKD